MYKTIQNPNLLFWVKEFSYISVCSFGMTINNHLNMPIFNHFTLIRTEWIAFQNANYRFERAK